MKIIFLGTGSGLPQPNTSHSCLLLETGKENIMLDCGEPAARNLISYNEDAEYLDAVAISHFHPDHVSGIYMLLQYLHIKKRKKKLYLYLPEREDDFLFTLQLFYLFPQKFPFKLVIDNVKNINHNYSFLNVKHGDHLKRYHDFVQANSLLNQMQCYSFVITSDNNRLIYTSDLAESTDIIEFTRDADIVIIDALHPAAARIIDLIRSGRTVYLTHGISAALDSAIQSENWENVIRADEKTKITF